MELTTTRGVCTPKLWAKYHSSLFEMAYAARLIAELIGTDSNIAARSFYHDAIGKAIDHDIGGAHDDISKEFWRNIL